MEHVIVGTAGHIDHGKTTLIKALTGRDTDRLEEEKRRGITIDLGFTYFDLEDGSRVGMIDVPGHEKFIHNMAAGVAGMDMVLLVVAADEGIMPQTREHIDILELLGVRQSILVLNKCDLSDENWLDFVETEIREELKGTFLENAPLVRVSALTGEGIPRLKEEIERMVREQQGIQKKDALTRLPVDRVFSLTGFGTIVTGTVLGGKIAREDILEVYPLQKKCRVRNIQVHGEDVLFCMAGQRAALNLAGCAREELGRGCVLAEPGRMQVSRLLDARLTLLESSKRTVKNQARLHFISGTSQVLCRAVLLDRQELAPGESCYAQLKMEREVSLCPGDRFLARFYSPVETIGGGVILQVGTEKKKRFSQEAIEEFRRREKGSPEDAVELFLRSYIREPVSEMALSGQLVLPLAAVQGAIRRLALQKKIFLLPVQDETYVWGQDAEQVCRDRICACLASYMARYPYRPGMSRAALKQEVLKEAKKQVFDTYLEELKKKNILKQKQEFLLPYGYEMPRDSRYLEVRRRLYGAVKPAKYDFVKLSDIGFGSVPVETVAEILAALVREGEIISLAEETYTLKSYMDDAREVIVERLKEEGRITVIQVRDLFQTNRRCAKMILEYMDRIKVTKKNGPESERAANL